MSGIVIDLQQQALSSEIDVLVLLRKAYLVARKLDLKEFEEWVSNEQNGYRTLDVPTYRVVRGEVKAWNPYHGWIPVIFDYDSGLTEHKVTDSLANIVELTKDSNKGECIVNFPPEINNILSKSAPFQTKYSLQISKNHLYNIIEQVRNKILDWAITLEENGIIGEGLTFSDDEKKIAKENSVINNYTNNFYSSVSDTQIQQDTTDSHQKQ